MSDLTIDFFLRLETLPPTPSVWCCRILRRGLREDKWKTVLVEATPIVLDTFSPDSPKEDAERGTEVWELAARHVGDDIFNIQRWCFCVHVADGSQADGPFVSQSWGELYPTLHAAQTSAMPCTERRHHLPWELVEAAGLLSWRALWHGFSRGYVDLDVVESFARKCLPEADESTKQLLEPFGNSGNLAKMLQSFSALAKADGNVLDTESELERRWADSVPRGKDNLINGRDETPLSPRDKPRSIWGLVLLRILVWCLYVLTVGLLVMGIYFLPYVCFGLGVWISLRIDALLSPRVRAFVPLDPALLDYFVRTEQRFLLRQAGMFVVVAVAGGVFFHFHGLNRWTEFLAVCAAGLGWLFFSETRTHRILRRWKESSASSLMVSPAGPPVTTLDENFFEVILTIPGGPELLLRVYSPDLFVKLFGNTENKEEGGR